MHVEAGVTASPFHAGEDTDCGLTVLVSCLKNKPNMRAVAERDTLEVIGSHLSIIRIQIQQSPVHAGVYSA